LVLLVAAACLGGAPLAVGDDPEKETDDERLTMTKAVACESVEGYGQFVKMAEPARTKDEKLLIYYEPRNYKYERYKKGYRAHLTQDARVRRKGEKTVLLKKDEMVKYEATSPQPPLLIYLTNTVSLKSLPPGEYELDIILHDKLGKTDATQSLTFRVKPTPVEAKSKEKDSDKAQPTEPGRSGSDRAPASGR
jgi:hypothetical protein